MNQHVGDAMLQRLKTADGLAELLAHAHVIDGGIHHRLHDAHRIGAQCRKPDVERRFDRRSARCLRGRAGSPAGTSTPLRYTSAARWPSMVG